LNLSPPPLFIDDPVPNPPPDRHFTTRLSRQLHTASTTINIPSSSLTTREDPGAISIFTALGLTIDHLVAGFSVRQADAILHRFFLHHSFFSFICLYHPSLNILPSEYINSI
jgi:hypothetical protein